MKQYALILAFFGMVWTSTAQHDLVFNHTEFDFGTIGQSSISFEHDFLFRNTNDSTVHVLSVSSLTTSLQFIYTRSEVLSGEYGFVKAKLRTDSLEGIFHDEVYVTLRQGQDVWSEILYLRAQVNADANAANGRQFQDSKIAVSVEVSPEDIQSMEGFSAEDEMQQAANEISYLQQQLALKSELISKLSEDLHKKQETEKENLQQLASIEESIKSGDNKNEAEIISQIEKLAFNLNKIQQSDKQLRLDISNQEATFKKLQAEADSARAFASDLSAKLEAQFKLQAEASAKAQQLERTLARKRKTEREQLAAIDSLNARIARATAIGNEDERIKELRAQLAWKQKEQQLQTEHAKFQHRKIDKLKEERQLLAMEADSLQQHLASSAEENDALKKQLAESDDRINKFKQEIDRLSNTASSVQTDSKSLDSLKNALAELERIDTELKDSVARKDEEIANLESQKDQAKKALSALENATNRQLEETHNLMYRVNTLSEKEGDAKLEIQRLEKTLERSQYKEQVARASVKTLEREIAEKEKRMANADAHEATLKSEISTLEVALLESKQNEQNSAAEASALEDRLSKARLSQEMAFEELRTDVTKMRTERDSIRGIVNANVIYKVLLYHNTKMPSSLPTVENYDNISVFQDHDKYAIAVGGFINHEKAKSEQIRLKKNGYPKAEIIGFKNGTRLTDKELGALAVLR